jgi:chaperone required for assembly of F1-ATPase
LKSGSIGIALLEGALTPKDAFEAAYVEEIVQRREWGEVEGDHDLNDAETMLWLNGIRLLNNCLVSAKSL